jgi:hypothetical protein
VRTVCYLAHCLLNANAKVDGGARCAGVSAPVVTLLRRHGCAIRQTIGRMSVCMVSARFRESVAASSRRGAAIGRLAEPVATQIRADLAAGARVIMIGIDGSPSMGVELTAASGEWGGRPDKPNDADYPVTSGPGLFTETLLALLAEEGPRVRVVGIGQDLFDYDEAAELVKVGRALTQPA